MSNEKILLYICVGAVCTIFLRALPFTLLGKKEIPDKIQYLGKILPPAIMAVLIVYCLKDVPVSFFRKRSAKTNCSRCGSRDLSMEKEYIFQYYLGDCLLHDFITYYIEEKH